MVKVANSRLVLSSPGAIEDWPRRSAMHFNSVEAQMPHAGMVGKRKGKHRAPKSQNKSSPSASFKDIEISTTIQRDSCPDHQASAFIREQVMGTSFSLHMKVRRESLVILNRDSSVKRKGAHSSKLQSQSII
ncbi:hypothetical protein TNCV_3990871 [Trichonephila clavipes]|uniref:Uncharacterized protein n=1 Tax=Trichonephila clavipes TaxID=2585209 RepID=A0A8X6T0J5_TRICX|nr:hypothetical protein TNCV_3990871 [Trichonephila clavipes]